MTQQPFPDYVSKYFWGDNLQELDLEKNKKYILQVLLEQGNQTAISWLLRKVNKQTIKNLLPTLKLSKKSANFWNIYLS